MRETLYIRLHAGAADEMVDFAVVAGDIAVRAPLVQRAVLDDALRLASTRRLVVFVPGAEVRLTSASVPARQPAKVLQAVPFALEDQVADDIDTLHFAIGPRQAEGHHPVAVVARRRMDEWMNAFRSHGLRPELLVPDVLALPWDGIGTSWSALREPDQVLVRNGAWSGFACDPADLYTFLQFADPDRAHPLRLLLVDTAAFDPGALDWPLELLPGYATPLAALIASFHPERAINLLQGAYSQRRDLQKLWQPWRLAASFAAAWLVISGIAFAVENWRLGREVAEQEKANIARFIQLFPTQTRIQNLEVQLDQQLRLAAAGGSGSLFPLLHTLTAALNANAGLKLTGLQYREGALFLSLTGSDLQVLESLRAWFASQPATALEVQSANAGSGGVQIRLKLSRA